MVLGAGRSGIAGLEYRVLGVVLLGKAGRAPKSNEFELVGTKVLKCNNDCSGVVKVIDAGEDDT